MITPPEDNKKFHQAIGVLTLIWAGAMMLLVGLGLLRWAIHFAFGE